MNKVDNIDEVEAYPNENGNYDVIIYLTQDGHPAKATWLNMHLNMEMNCDGSVKLVFES